VATAIGGSADGHEHDGTLHLAHNTAVPRACKFGPSLPSRSPTANNRGRNCRITNRSTLLVVHPERFVSGNGCRDNRTSGSNGKQRHWAVSPELG
jgi:hypothetical protein